MTGIYYVNSLAEKYIMIISYQAIFMSHDTRALNQNWTQMYHVCSFVTRYAQNAMT